MLHGQPLQLARRDQTLDGVTKAYNRRVKAASIYLSSTVKADISQAGTLRYTTFTKSKKTLQFEKQKTVYNFTHSVPGNPPFKQTGHLRRSITWELAYKSLQIGAVGRVGTNLKYGRYLELGTRRMAARPYLRRALAIHQAALRRILTARIGPGELPAIASNQSRSGVLGRGAIRAGFG